MRRKLSAPLSAILVVAAAGVMTLETKIWSQSIVTARDPGVRGGVPGAGGPLVGLTAQETEYFTAGKLDFDEAEEPDEGMGPRMNLDSCRGCHSQPAVGGTSPAVNPQFAFAGQDGGLDTIPSFIKVNGPVREARFIANRDGTADGGVHALITVTGRPGADGCTLKQPHLRPNWRTGTSRSAFRRRSSAPD